jgi:hypothetical protein
MSVKTRLAKLARRQGPQAGGVVLQLPGGGYQWRGGHYADLADLPGPGGALVIPLTLAPEQWDPLALEVHRRQEMEVQK